MLLIYAVIDDYVFEPCGYSMNSQQAGVFSTIHITPEDGFSYASFELCGYDPAALDTGEERGGPKAACLHDRSHNR